MNAIRCYSPTTRSKLPLLSGIGRLHSPIPGIIKANRYQHTNLPPARFLQHDIAPQTQVELPSLSCIYFAGVHS